VGAFAPTLVADPVTMPAGAMSATAGAANAANPVATARQAEARQLLVTNLIEKPL
jgi:hypothetical protein